MRSSIKQNYIFHDSVEFRIRDDIFNEKENIFSNSFDIFLYIHLIGMRCVLCKHDDYLIDIAKHIVLSIKYRTHTDPGYQCAHYKKSKTKTNANIILILL